MAPAVRIPATKPLPPNLDEIAARASVNAGPDTSDQKCGMPDRESPRSSATSSDEEIGQKEKKEGDSSSIASTSVYGTDVTHP